MQGAEVVVLAERAVLQVAALEAEVAVVAAAVLEPLEWHHMRT